MRKVAGVLLVALAMGIMAFASYTSDFDNSGKPSFGFNSWYWDHQPYKYFPFFSNIGIHIVSTFSLGIVVFMVLVIVFARGLALLMKMEVGDGN